MAAAVLGPGFLFAFSPPLEQTPPRIASLAAGAHRSSRCTWAWHSTWQNIYKIPIYFTYPCEFAHWRTAHDIAASGHRLSQ